MLRKFSKLCVFLLVFMFAIALSSCKDNKPKEEDKIAPIITIQTEEVELFAGEKARAYDLMTGVTARDNIDGTITNKVTIDEGDFNPDVPGEYIITYTVKDSSNNVTIKTRTIIVLETVTGIIIGDKFYESVVANPQILPQYVGASFGFDLTKVQVFSKDFVAWVMENCPERFASFYGAVAVVDAEGKVVHTRFNEKNVIYDDEGAVVSIAMNDLTWANYPEYAKLASNLYPYIPITGGGCLGDILRFIPDGGFVVFGVNDGPNDLGSPRDFIVTNVLSKENSGLGTIIEFSNIVASFSEGFPIIKVPYTVVDEDKVDATLVTKVVLYQDDIPNLLEGVTAKSTAGVDITNLIETKIYHYSAMKRVETLNPNTGKVNITGPIYFDEEPLEKIDTSNLEPGSGTKRYMVEYSVTDPDNGKTDTSWRLYEVVAPEKPVLPNVLIYGDTEEEVIYNDPKAVADLYNSGINMRLDDYNPNYKIYVYSRRGYLAALDDSQVKAKSALNGGAPLLPWSIVVVVDKDGKVVQYRNWQKVFDGEGNDITANYPNAIKSANGGADQNGGFSNIDDVIPVDGYLIVFSATASNNLRFKGLKIFWNPDATASNDLESPRTVDWTQSVVSIQTSVVEQVSAFYGLEEKEIQFNNIWALKSNGTNTNMRFAADGKFFVYTKAGYESALNDEEVLSTNAYNGGLPYIPYGAAAILDKNGLILYFRVDNVGEYKGDGTLTPYASAEFDDQLVSNGKGGLLVGLLDKIPEDGYLIIFPFTGVKDQKAIALKMLWNPEGNINLDRRYDWSKSILKIQEMGQYASPFEVAFIEEEVQDTPYNSTIGDVTYKVTLDDEDMWQPEAANNYIGRTEAFSTKTWHIITKNNADLLIKDSSTTPIEYYQCQWLGMVIVCNEDGTIKFFRFTGKPDGTNVVTEVVYFVDGEKVVATVGDPLWLNPTNNDLLVGLGELIPENGFAITIPGHFGPHIEVREFLTSLTDEELATYSFLKPVEPEVPVLKIGDQEFEYTTR